LYKEYNVGIRSLFIVFAYYFNKINNFPSSMCSSKCTRCLDRSRRKSGCSQTSWYDYRITGRCVTR